MSIYNELKLSELNKLIKKIINDEVFSSPLWIIAEISDFKIAKNGHCYLDLVEKEGDKIVAKSRATIWSFRCAIIKDYFYQQTGKELKEGIKILFYAEVRFHELYGFSLNILDIQPSFTIGELAKQKEEVIKKLKEEGVFDLNKETIFPPVIQNIAIISSETAAGYEDFVNTLENNKYDYVFKHKLFHSLLQGDEAKIQIIEALNKIYENYEDYDVVVVIRGGGAKLDMDVFNDYEVTSNVAQFPLPVISGIGHTRDVSIMDMVVKTSVKTPTAAAEFIINHNHEFETYIESLSVKLNKSLQSYLTNQTLLLQNLPLRLQTASNKFFSDKINEISLNINKLQASTKSFFDKKKHKCQTLKLSLHESLNNYFDVKKKSISFIINKLQISSEHYFYSQNNKLTNLEEKLKNLNPEILFKRGYHLVTGKNGKIIADINEIKTKDIINIHFNKGKVETEVKKIIKNTND